jgi:hypothetical protein
MHLDLKATPAQRMDMLVAAGCAVVFSANPDLSGTYGLDPVTLNQVMAAALGAGAGLGLPLGAPVFVYPDKSNTPKTFTSDEIQTLFKALRDYTAGLTYYASGQTPDPPAQPVTV